MANILPELLSQLVEEDVKYYLLKGRELIQHEDNYTVLQNDKNSSKIRIIMPEKINGYTLNADYDYYIDFLDGKGKPGVVANETTITTVKKVVGYDENGTPQYKEISKFDEVSNQNGYIINNNVLTIGDKSATLERENLLTGTATIDNIEYIVTYNIEYIPTEVNRTYNSNEIIQDYESSAKISADYPHEYARNLYFKKVSKNLTTISSAQQDINTNGDLVKYIYLEWTLDQEITAHKGEIVFSIRIENKDTDFLWQSSTGSFKVIENLNETYYLRNEIEENFVIQNRTIKPVGNIEAALVKGDTNSNKLYYKINRYYQGQDLLEERNDVFKTEDDAFIINSYYANILYKITKGVLYSANDSSEQYMINISGNNGVVNINDNEYIFSLKKEFNINTSKYEQKLIYNEENQITLENFQGTVMLDEKEYTISLSATAIDFEQTENKYEGKILPVYNRLIRFVFLSPNKDYGDWNNAEIEYVDDEYFIFSWTPDYRATRSEGEVSYYIEFFINGLNALVQNESGVVSEIETKTYSWSTLPSTIKVESNAAATPSVDYLPHWVGYIENQLATDVDLFIHGELQSQYDNFQNTILNKIFENYNKIEAAYDRDKNHYTFSDSFGSNTPINYTLSIVNTEDEKSYILTYNNLTITGILNNVANNIWSALCNITENNINKTYYFSYNVDFDQILILSPITQEDTNDTRPLVPVFWENLEKILSQKKQQYSETDNNFRSLQSAIEQAYGVTLDEGELDSANLKEQISQAFLALYGFLNSAYNNQTSLIAGGYQNGEPINGTFMANQIIYNDTILEIADIDAENKQIIVGKYKNAENTTFKEEEIYYSFSRNEFFKEITDWSNIFYLDLSSGEDNYISYNPTKTTNLTNFYIQNEGIYTKIEVYYLEEKSMTYQYTNSAEEAKTISANGVCFYFVSVIESLKKSIEEKHTDTETELEEWKDTVSNTLNNTLNSKVSETQNNLTTQLNTLLNNNNAFISDSIIAMFNTQYEELRNLYLQEINDLQNSLTSQFRTETMVDVSGGILHINSIASANPSV